MKKHIYCMVMLLFLTGFHASVLAGDFTDNGNGAVTDNVTGLMWQKEDDNASRTWEQALAYCEGLMLAGYTDWRLPDIKELRSIVDNTRYTPSIDTAVFPNTKASSYWSSTTSAYNTVDAWSVGFYYGSVYYSYKPYSLYARCVR